MHSLILNTQLATHLIQGKSQIPPMASKTPPFFDSQHPSPLWYFSEFFPFSALVLAVPSNWSVLFSNISIVCFLTFSDSCLKISFSVRLP